MILMSVMAFFALIALGCLAVRNKKDQIPGIMLIIGPFFMVGMVACLYLLITGDIK